MLNLNTYSMKKSFTLPAILLALMALLYPAVLHAQLQKGETFWQDGFCYQYAGGIYLRIVDVDKNHFSGTKELIVPGEVTYNGQTYNMDQIGHKGFLDEFVSVSDQYKNEEMIADTTQTGLFEGWDALESVAFLDWNYNCTAISVHLRAFRGCRHLKRIQVPYCVVSCLRAFDQCPALTDITLLPSAEQRGFTVDNNIVYGPCPQDASKRQLLFCPEGISTLTVKANDLGYYEDRRYEGGSKHNSIKKLIVEPDVPVEAACAMIDRSHVEDIEVPEGYPLRFENSLVILPSTSGEGSILVYALQSAKGHINVPGDVVTVNPSAFCDCKYITSVNFPPTIREILSETFGNCTALEQINMPDSLSSIGSQAIYNCNALRTLDLSHTNLTEISSRSISECPALQEVKFPAMVTTINSFDNCPALQRIDFPSQVRNINGFYGCTALREINFPVMMEAIWGFDGCTALQKVEFPKSVESINGFDDCTALQEIKFPEYVTSLYGFNGCTALQKIDLPETPMTIGGFRFCTALQNFELPAWVRLKDGAFAGCTQWERFNLSADNPYHKVDGKLLYTADGDTLVSVLPGLKDELVLTAKVIGPYALCGLTEITDLVLGPQVTWLDYSNLMYFDYPVRYGDAALKRIVCKSLTPPQVSVLNILPPVFLGEMVELVVPDIAEANYADTTPWSFFTHRSTIQLDAEDLTCQQYLASRAETRDWGAYLARVTTEVPGVVPTSEAWNTFAAAHPDYLYITYNDSAAFRISLWNCWNTYIACKGEAAYDGHGRTVKCLDGTLRLLDEVDNDFINWMLSPHFYHAATWGTINTDRFMKSIVTCTEDWNVPGNRYAVFSGLSAYYSPIVFFYLPIPANYPCRISVITAPDTETTTGEPRKNKWQGIWTECKEPFDNGRIKFVQANGATNEPSPTACDTVLLAERYCNTEFGIHEQGNLQIRDRATASNLKNGYTHDLRIVGVWVEPLEPAELLPTVLTEAKADAEPAAPGVKAALRNRLFDLSGREITGTPAPGLYIKNGKKFIIK